MKYVEKFFVCPNCKQPLFRASAVKKGLLSGERHCTRCSADITRAMKKALVEKED